LYKVIKHFTDMQDGNYAYDPSDPARNIYPRKGLSVLPSRIKELASDKNRQGVPLIEEIPDIEETPEKKTKSTKKG
jgi:hypothetical protein